MLLDLTLFSPELIDGMILKYQARRWAGATPAPVVAKTSAGKPRARAAAR